MEERRGNVLVVDGGREMSGRCIGCFYALREIVEAHDIRIFCLKYLVSVTTRATRPHRGESDG